jgi:hypothetical protein
MHKPWQRISPPRRWAVSLAGATLAFAQLARAQEQTQETRPRSQPASYAFATQIGSGLYEVDDRMLLIYRLPLSNRLREATSDRWGWRATLPVTVGFYDFSPADVIQSGLPDRLDSYSFVPGLEAELQLREDWRLFPFVQAGASLASGQDWAALYGAGIRSEHDFLWRRYIGRQHNEIGWAGVDYRSEGQGADDFLRLRSALELRRGTRRTMRGREIEVGAFTIVDAFLDAPRPPGTGARANTLQFEAGVVFGLQPPPRFRRLTLPRLGVGYRLAGDLSGWHLVIGSPF